MKFSQYDYFLNCNGGIAIVNTFNSKYVKITKKDDIDHLIKLCHDELPLTLEDNIVKDLYEQGYIVDSGVDEYKLAKAEVDSFFHQYEKNLHLTLYVTEQCNFRCVYCPEKHIDSSFSNENWDALYKYIEKGIKNGKYESVNISFFGGEPLLEVEKIIMFLERLKDLSKIYSDVIFEHQITTNGYLLAPEVYDKLVSLGVLQYQITVDGFAETHNKLRLLAGGQGTWDKIIENLKYINTKNDNAHIILRTNYNASNVKTLEDYKKWQIEAFNNKKFYLEFHPISAFSESVPKELLSDENSEDSYNVQEKLKNGMLLLKKFKDVCNSAYPNSYTISSKGEITKCENISSENYEQLIIGHLGSNGDFVLKEGVEAWFENFETEDCQECIAYPICCARSCPAKKALCPKTRPDCSEMTEHFEKRLTHLFENNI